MKIVVCLKQVPDTETKLKLHPDGTGIEDAGVKWIVNPYDEFAIEESLRMREKLSGSTVYAMTLGPKSRCVEALRTALAMGVDEGVVLDCTDPLDSFATAKALASGVQKLGDVQYVLTGRLAIDDNSSSVAQMMAQHLKWPHATVISKIEYGDNVLTLEREIEGGSKEVFTVKGPAVIAANKGLNTPRYASLPGIMKAKKKPIQEWSMADVGYSPDDIKIRLKNFRLPPEKPPVKMLSGDVETQVRELIRNLRETSKVL